MKHEEKWEVVGKATGPHSTGATRTEALIRFADCADADVVAKWIDGGEEKHPTSNFYVRRVTEPTKADKLIARMTDLEQQLTAMRDDLTEELNKP